MMSPTAVFPKLIQDLFDTRQAQDLVAEHLPERFARRDGAWNGRPLVLETQAFQGHGFRLRLAEVRSDGAMESLTVLFLPPRESTLPIFGADVVAFGGTLSAVIVDVTPKGPWLPRPTVVKAKEMLESSGTVRAFSSDSETPFSPEVVFVQPRAGGSTSLLSGFSEMVRAWDSSVGSNLVDEKAAALAEDAYLGKLALVKRQAKVVSKLFGAHWTEGYFQCFFSPDIGAHSAGVLASTIPPLSSERHLP
jgi:hypothetical protein